MNRLKQPHEGSPSGEPVGDYWEIETRDNYFVISREVARAVERALSRPLVPQWIVFRVLSGSRHRVRARSIHRVSESTAAQRAAAREFFRARRLEVKADKRPWEDDD
jgi:hypothetical protein